MDDRDKDLTRLFVRDLDALPLPPRGAWRRAPRKEHIAMRASRSLAAAGVAVAVLVLALIVGLQLRDRGDTAASPSGSPRPSPSASASAGAISPTGGPSVLPTATPARTTGPVVFDDRFGFVVSAVGASAGIRPEGGAGVADVGTINGTGVVPSPTGDRVAYLSGVPAPAIHIRTFADGSDRTVATLAAGERLTSIAWSSDGNGLLFGTGSGAGVGAGSGAEATLRTLELSGGDPMVIARRNDGRAYAPIAWDRTAKLAAASEGGPGGFTAAYLTFDLSQTPARTKVTPISGQVIGPLASTDAKYVLMVDVNSAEVRYWPIADAAAVKVAGKNYGAALWQPGTHNIGYVTIAGDAFRLFGADDGSSTTVFQGLKTGIAVQPGSSLRTFRADGTAVLLATPVGTGLGATDYLLIRLSDGVNATFQTVGGLGASVRLRN